MARRKRTEEAAATTTETNGDAPAKRKRGRPTLFSEATADRILSMIAEDQSLRAICERSDMPSAVTVYKWLRENEDFYNKYARARDDQAQSSEHRMRQIEDQVASGELEPNAARVILDSIKWRASKLAPKRYGDKLQHVGDGGSGAIQVQLYIPDNGRDADSS